MRNSTPLGPYSRNMPRALWWPSGGVLFLISEAPLLIFTTRLALNRDLYYSQHGRHVHPHRGCSIKTALTAHLIAKLLQQHTYRGTSLIRNCPLLSSTVGP